MPVKTIVLRPTASPIEQWLALAGPHWMKLDDARLYPAIDGLQDEEIDAIFAIPPFDGAVDRLEFLDPPDPFSQIKGFRVWLRGARDGDSADLLVRLRAGGNWSSYRLVDLVHAANLTDFAQLWTSVTFSPYVPSSQSSLAIDLLAQNLVGPDATILLDTVYLEILGPPEWRAESTGLFTPGASAHHIHPYSAAASTVFSSGAAVTQSLP